MGYLVLSRRTGQSIICNLKDDERIKITILNAGDYQTRVAIEAPRYINIVREELLHKMLYQEEPDDSQPPTKTVYWDKNHKVWIDLPVQQQYEQ